jgi:hypothetical protein
VSPQHDPICRRPSHLPVRRAKEDADVLHGVIDELVVGGPQFSWTDGYFCTPRTASLPNNAPITRLVNPVQGTATSFSITTSMETGSNRVAPAAFKSSSASKRQEELLLRTTVSAVRSRAASALPSDADQLYQAIKKAVIPVYKAIHARLPAGHDTPDNHLETMEHMSSAMNVPRISHPENYVFGSTQINMARVVRENEGMALARSSAQERVADEVRPKTRPWRGRMAHLAKPMPTGETVSCRGR